jgi:hypothetical protein
MKSFVTAAALIVAGVFAVEAANAKPKAGKFNYFAEQARNIS